jgi:hypothetical protein
VLAILIRTGVEFFCLNDRFRIGSHAEKERPECRFKNSASAFFSKKILNRFIPLSNPVPF